MKTAAISLVLAFAACGFAQEGGSQSPAVSAERKDPSVSAAPATDPASLAAPKADPGDKPPQALAVDQRTYVIGAQDVLLVSVWQQKDLGGNVIVRPDGKISLPFGGELTAAGRTPVELSKDISDRLTKFIRDPQVSIQLLQSNSRKYYIQGEVLKPGEYPLIMPTRVLQALVNAGGFRDFANTKNIVILRNNGKQVLKFNYNDVIKGKNLEQNVPLQPDDMIVVK
jgi:polysaccharide export outer membrane protein